MQPGWARTSGLGVPLLPLARWVGWVAPVRPTNGVLVLSCPSAALRVCGVLGHVAPVHPCARVVVLCLRCPGPLDSCSPVRPPGVLCCVCGVLGYLAPVHRCARSVCCGACAVSRATWLLFTGVPARWAVLRVRCPGPPAPVHRCARSVCCVACVVSWATWLLFTGAPAWYVVLRLRCPGPLRSCSPVRPLGVLCCVCGVLCHLAPFHRCARWVCCVACAMSWATWLLFTGAPAWCLVLHVRCPGPLGSRSSVCPLAVLCCVCSVLGHLAPVHRCARSVLCFACALSRATWLLFTGVPAQCVALCVRCPGPLGCRSPVCPLSVLCCACGVLGHLAPVHLCSRSVCCVACAMSWATWLLFTGAPAWCLVLRVRCPGPLGSRSPVCPLAVLCCVCSVLGHLAPVHRCARSVFCFACALSRATWLLFTGVPAQCVALCVPCPGPLGCRSPVCPLSVLCCACGVLGHLAPVHLCSRSVCCVACAVSWATWLLFTGAPAPSFALVVRCPGPHGSCSPVCPLAVLCCVCSVLGHLAPVHRCALSVCCFACGVSWVTWLLFTGVPAPSFALLVRCPGPLGSCSPVCPLGVLLCVCGVLGHVAPVHRCARSVGCVARAMSWVTWLPFTGVPARWVVLHVRCTGPLGSCSPVCSLCVLCFGLRVRCCVCWASLRGARSSIRTAAVRSRQGLGTLRARTHPSGWRPFVAGRGWVRCRACTRPSGQRLFEAGRGWVPSGRAHVHPDGGWCRLAPVPVPWFLARCARSPGLRHPAAVVAWHLSVFLGCGRRRASLAGLVAPRGAPRLVQSGPSRCSGRLSRRRGAFPHPGSLRPRLYWVAARGTRRPAENQAHCACRRCPPRQGRWARSASSLFGAQRWGCPWRVPPASVLGCVRCGGWCVWSQSLMRPVSRTVRLSTGDWAGAPGLFRVDADTSPCGSEDATPGSCACVRVLVRPGRVGRAGLPGAFWCASPFPLAALSFCFAWPPPGWGCPFLGPLFALSPPPFPFFFFFFSLLLFSARPLCLLLSLVVSGPGCPESWRCVLFVLLALRFSALRALSPLLCCPPGRWLLSGGCPPPFCVSRFLLPPLGALYLVFLCFFFPLLSAPPLSLASSGSPAPGALGLGAVLCFFFLPSASRIFSPVLCLPLGRWLLPAGCCPPPPLPFCVSRFSSLPLGALFFFSSSCVRPRCLRLALVSGPGRPGPWRCVLFVLWASRCPALRALSPCLCVPPGRWLLPGGCCPPPPPLLCLAVFVAAARCSVLFFFLRCAPCNDLGDLLF